MRMRRWLTIAVVASAMASPAWAQHGSSSHGGGGFSGGGHASGGFSGGAHFSGGSSSGFHGNPGAMRPMPRYGGAGAVHTGVARPGASRAPLGSHYGTANNGAGRNGIAASRAAAGRNGYPGSGGGNRGNGNRGGGNRGRGPRLYAYSGNWWLGPYQFYPWLDSGLSWDYWNDTGDDDDAIAMASTGADMVADAPPSGGGPDDGDADAGQDPDPPLHGTAMQLEGGAPSLTLVYRSGQTEQVANYVVSKTGVTVVDASGVRSVPVADLNVVGTIQANAQSGMQLPSSWQ